MGDFSKVSPEVLVGDSREFYRECSSIRSDIEGIDSWVFYDFYTLYPNGMPLCGILKFKIGAESANIIEPDSLRQYLDSWNVRLSRELFIINPDNDQYNFISVIQKHLEQITESPVDVAFYDIEDSNYLKVNGLNSIPIKYCEYKEDFLNSDDDFTISSENDKLLNIVTLLDEKKSKNNIRDLPFTHYHKVSDDGKVCDIYVMASNILCNIGNGPLDKGTVIIQYYNEEINPNDTKLISSSSFLKYITSLREMSLIKEECCEKIFCDIMEVLNPDKLCVSCSYVRSGGLQLDAVRTTLGDEYFFCSQADVYNVGVLTKPLPRQ